jgi:3-deoxy-D-manno-octulosonic-acid transferase
MAAWPEPPGVDRIDYAPADLPSPVAAVFNSLRPSIIVVSRGDLWPEMVRGALARHVPVAVVGGAVGRSSNRLRWPVRQLLAAVHRHLAFVGARSAEDASRWIRLGARQEVVHVTGDPRNDYILERVTGKPLPQPLAAWGSAGHVMVAGSTHPQDEELLIDAFAVIASRDKAARLLVVPHEPGRASLRRIVSQARRLGLEAAPWNGSPAEIRAQIVVVDEAGVLGDLYAVGTLAYVGGGFGTSGVHSLAEPAAWGVPVLAGPGVSKDAAAQALLESGGVTAISGPDPLAELVEKWMRWLGDPEARSAAGLAARAQIRYGAAEESVQALERLLGIVVEKD